MALFKVVVAETAYTGYLVEASSEDQARAVVGNQSFRAQAEWSDEGYGDDAEVISVQKT
jgi:hypothetical protein